MFGDKDNEKPLSFKELRQSVSDASEPVVGAVEQYRPYTGKGKYKPDLKDLPEALSTFFRSTADAIEARSTQTEQEATLDAAAQTVKDAKLDKKAKDLADKGSKLLSDRLDDTQSTLADAKLDKKAGKLAKNLGDSVKDARLDKKAADLTSNAGTALAGVAAPVVATLSDLASKAGDTVKSVELDKKLGDVTSNLGGAVKDAKLDKRAADVVGAAGEVVSNVGDTVSSFLKDAKLDKKAGDVAGNVSSLLKDAKLDKKAAELATTAAGVAAPLLAKVKEVELDKKAADVADTVSSRLKDAKLDKKLAEAQLPEKVFTAANLIPGVEVKNPRKAAKQFRKRRKEVIKAVNLQQKELNKALSQRSKDVQKYVQARQKDIQSGKIRIPGYEPPKKKSGFPWGRTLLVGGAVYGGLAANNTRIWSNVPPLQSKLPGEAHYYRSRQGVIFYKEAGQDQEGKAPIVFVHGIGAGNHSYEWEPNFGAVSQQYKTYAFDLLGFGGSERPNLRYTGEVYIKQLTEFLDEVVKRPAIVVASSLSSSYAVQVAFRRPQLIEKLVLMEPTGVFRREGQTGPNLFGPLSGAAYQILRAPVLGKAIYSGVASKSGIKSFMQNQMFYNKDLATPDRIEQYWIAAHQDGAEFAPPSFFTGLLNAEIGETLSKIQQPVFIVWGSDSRITPPQERQDLSQRNKSAKVETIQRARLAVNQEHPDRFNQIVLDFAGQATQPVQTGTETVGFVHNQTDTKNEAQDRRPVNQQLPPLDQNQSQPDYATTEPHYNRSEKGNETGNLDAAQASGQGLEYNNDNLKQELEEHRKTFIGDASTGGALVQDSDNDGVDDRQV
jgi:pimeloyl-ACP methyl ester carboxylesterase